MKTSQHEPPHENDAELTVVRFDDGAKRKAQRVVPLCRASHEKASGSQRRKGGWPLGMILALGLVTAVAGLAGVLYREEMMPATAATAAAPASDTPSTAHLDIAQTAAEAVTQAEAPPESTEATPESDDVADDVATSPRRTRARRFSSFRYVPGRFDRGEDDDDDTDAEERAEKAREGAEKRAERARKEAEERAERTREDAEKRMKKAREEAEERAERRREREKDRDRRPRLVGSYTLRSRN